MANSLVTKPMIISADIANYRTDSTVVALGGVGGVRVTKLVLAVGSGGVSSAGTVSITAPSDSAVLYPPLVVLASQAANTILYIDEPTDTKGSLTWRNFAVTGITATGTVLYLWVDV